MYRHEEDKSFYAYKTQSSNKICYFCYRLDHTAIHCQDVKCYACGMWCYARHCSVNRSHSSCVFESKQGGCSSDNGHSKEGKSSAVRFTQDITGIDNTLKRRVRVDGNIHRFCVRYWC